MSKRLKITDDDYIERRLEGGPGGLHLVGTLGSNVRTSGLQVDMVYLYCQGTGCLPTSNLDEKVVGQVRLWEWDTQ